MHDATGQHRPPKQERSRETLERILTAAESLLDGRPFAEISVDDIVNHADVSRSSFYARFENKDALLPLLYERYASAGRSALAVALSVDAEMPPEFVVDQLVRSYLGFVRRFQFETSTYETSALGSPRRELMDDVVEGVVRVYLNCVGRPDDEALAQRVEFASRAVAAILLRAVGPPTGFASMMGFDDERLVAEVSLLATSYLRAAAGD